VIHPLFSRVFPNVLFFEKAVKSKLPFEKLKQHLLSRTGSARDILITVLLFAEITDQ